MVLQPLLIMVLQPVCLLAHSSLCLVTKPSKAVLSGENIEKCRIVVLHLQDKLPPQLQRRWDAVVAAPCRKELDERSAVG